LKIGLASTRIGGVVSRRIVERDKAPPGRVTDSGPFPITQIGPLGKPVGAVVAAAKVLRALHASERPLNASELARAAGLHRGTAYNILRTLQAAGLVGYVEATRTYAVSLNILELACGVLRRSGLIDSARPLMHAVSDVHAVSVYLSKVLGPSSLLLLDWVGVALRPDPHVTVGRQYRRAGGAYRASRAIAVVCSARVPAMPRIRRLLS
jgi:hypothetical protein